MNHTPHHPPQASAGPALRAILNDTQPFTIADLVAAACPIDTLDAHTQHPRPLTVADIAASIGYSVVEARCRQLIAQGHREAAAAISAELHPTPTPTATPPAHDPRSHRLRHWFTATLAGVVGAALHTGSPESEGAPR